MRIGIDARMYSQSGIGRYIRNLIKNLQLLDKKNNYFILLQKDEYQSLNLSKNFQKVLAEPKWYSFSEQIEIPKILNKLNLDLVHFPHFNIPIYYKGKFIVTIHDLIHQHFQMKRVTALNPFIYKLKQFAYKKVFKNAVINSQKILVPSNYVKGLLVNEWKIVEEKIVVTHEAVDDNIFSSAKTMKDEKIRKVRDKFNIKPHFIFYIGNAHPHKNVEGLIEAFLALREKDDSLQLVLSGSDHYFWQRIKEKYHHQGIVYTGKITDEELVALYKDAQVFVMPSFEEGFGIPILEAFACDCPVVSSNAGSLIEVGGEAIIYFNPLNTLDLSSKIYRVLSDGKLRKELIEKGKERVKLFSWRTMVEKTLKIYQEVL